MNIDNIIKQVSIELNVPEDIVAKIYKLYWKGIKSHLSSLPLKRGMSEDEFNKLQTSVNIPRIGKMYITYKSFLNQLKRLDYKNGRIFNESSSGEA